MSNLCCGCEVMVIPDYINDHPKADICEGCRHKKKKLIKLLEKFYTKKVSIKEYFSFAKGRITLYIYALVMGTIMIDLFGWHFWVYAIIFAPIDLTINYIVMKYIFHKKK